jgi:hypothetical protein
VVLRLRQATFERLLEGLGDVEHAVRRSNVAAVRPFDSGFYHGHQSVADLRQLLSLLAIVRDRAF